jgi:hypothetical protein
MKALDTSDVDAILPFVPEEGEAAQRVHVPAEDCLEAVDDLVCHHYSVGGLMGLARMPALALDSLLEAVGGPGHHAAAHTHPPHG